MIFAKVIFGTPIFIGFWVFSVISVIFGDFGVFGDFR